MPTAGGRGWQGLQEGAQRTTPLIRKWGYAHLEVIPALKETPRNAETQTWGIETKQKKVPKMPRSRGTVLGSPELLPSSGPDRQFQMQTSHPPSSRPSVWPEGSAKQGSHHSPQEDAGALSSALRQAIGCCHDGKDVSGGGGWKQKRRLPEMGIWGLLGVGRPAMPWTSVNGTCWGFATWG